MTAMENTAAAVPENEAQLQELHRTMRARARRKNRTQKTVLVALNTFMAIFMMLPLLYAISVALMPSNELNSMAMNLVPSHPTLENVKNALSQVSLGKFILNSFIVAGCITAGQIITCSLAAFSFSFLEFKGKNFLFMLVFLFRQFYLTFPISLYESAKLDGCSNICFIVKILMPLTKAAIGAMAVYTFINAWNMYLWPLLVTGSDSMRTVQIGISMLNAVDAQSISLTMAGVVICMLPSLIIFIVGQKQMIRGMFSGAVKG